MATGFPVKANYATGDVLTAANMNDLAGTLNQMDPTAKGDLFPASDGSTLTRLAVGADYTIVQALSSATTGLTYGGGWTSYTPTWTAATTNPVIGNGILEGVYRRIGGECEFAIKLSAGTTTTFGSGIYRLSLPIVALDSGWNGTYQVGILDNGVAWYHKYYGYGFADGFNDKFIISDSANNYWADNTPFTFGNTDSVYVQGRYRVGA